MLKTQLSPFCVLISLIFLCDPAFLYSRPPFPRRSNACPPSSPPSPPLPTRLSPTPTSAAAANASGNRNRTYCSIAIFIPLPNPSRNIPAAVDRPGKDENKRFKDEDEEEDANEERGEDEGFAHPGSPIKGCVFTSTCTSTHVNISPASSYITTRTLTPSPGVKPGTWSRRMVVVGWSSIKGQLTPGSLQMSRVSVRGMPRTCTEGGREGGREGRGGRRTWLSRGRVTLGPPFLPAAYPNSCSILRIHHHPRKGVRSRTFTH